MRSLVDIFDEPEDDQARAADRCDVYDDRRKKVATFAPLPAKIKFTLPANSRWFDLEVPGLTIHQELVPTP